MSNITSRYDPAHVQNLLEVYKTIDTWLVTLKTKHKAFYNAAEKSTLYKNVLSNAHNEVVARRACIQKVLNKIKSSSTPAGHGVVEVSWNFKTYFSGNMILSAHSTFLGTPEMEDVWFLYNVCIMSNKCGVKLQFNEDMIGLHLTRDNKNEVTTYQFETPLYRYEISDEVGNKIPACYNTGQMYHKIKQNNPSAEK